jgi:hypothetical protein
MKKHEVVGSQIDLHRFFEASVRALQNESKFAKTQNRAERGNRALVQRNETDGSQKRQALADAAKALAALWKVQPLSKTT